MPRAALPIRCRQRRASGASRRRRWHRPGRARRNGHETNPTKAAIARKQRVGDAFSLSHGYQVTLLFLLHDHQDSLFARRQPPGVEGRGRVGRKIAVQRSEKLRGFRFFLA